MLNKKEILPYGEIADNGVNLFHGDCLDIMQSIPDGSVDAIICDPPYG